MYVPANVDVTPAQLGLSENNLSVTLYVEAVQADTANYWAHAPIEAKLANDGSNFASTDTVNTTVVYSEAGWKQLVYQKSGFNPYIWNPGNGYAFNHDDLSAIYSFYDQLYNQSVTDAGGNPNAAKFQWPGIAKVAGAQIMSGLAFSTNAATYLSLLQGLINQHQNLTLLPNPLSAALLITQLTNAGPLAPQQILAVQKQTMRGSFGIFDDLTWNFEAYEIGGIREIQRQAALGTITSRAGKSGFDMLQAWQSIDSGVPNNIWAGNLEIIAREQNVVLQPLLAPFNGLSVFGVPASVITTWAGGFNAPFPGAQSMLAWENSSNVSGLFTTSYVRLAYIQYLWSVWQQLPGNTRFADVGVALP
jgi:hypothetical protein